MNYQYQTIYQQDLPKYLEKLAKFFKDLGYQNDYQVAINNSAFVCICFENGKIVGACRVLSDLCRFAYLVDLNVEPKYRR